MKFWFLLNGNYSEGDHFGGSMACEPCVVCSCTKQIVPWMVLNTAVRSCMLQSRAVEYFTSYAWQCASEAVRAVLYQPTAHPRPFPLFNEQWFIVWITTRPGKWDTTVVYGQILTVFIFPFNYLKRSGYYTYHVLQSWAMRRSEMYLWAPFRSYNTEPFYFSWTQSIDKRVYVFF